MRRIISLAVAIQVLACSQVVARPLADEVSVAGAFTDTLAVCAVPPAWQERIGGDGGRPALASTTTLAALPAPGELTLVKQGGQYALMMQERPLLDGRDLEPMVEDAATLHLVVDGGSEHFLFLFRRDGSADLIWSTASDHAMTECHGVDNGLPWPAVSAR